MRLLPTVSRYRLRFLRCFEVLALHILDEDQLFRCFSGDIGSTGYRFHVHK